LADHPRVLHISSVHTPFDTRIFERECRALATAGYDVAYLVQHDREEVRNGVRIVPLPRASGRRQRRRLVLPQVLPMALEHNAAVYHLHDPELLPTAAKLKRLGRRVIYDAHEDLGRQMLGRATIPVPARPLAAWGAGWMEKHYTKPLDALVAAHPVVAERLWPEKCTLLMNYPYTNELTLADPTPLADRPCCVVYAGGISALRGITEMVDAMAPLPADLAARLVLAGPAMPESYLEELKARPGWSRVDYLGNVERQRLREVYGSARAGLVCFLPTAHHMTSFPNKIFEYLSVGLPVIASDLPHWRALLEGARCVLFVDPRDPRSVAEAVARVLREPSEAEEMGARGVAAVKERFNWEAESRKLLAVYERVLGGQ
jgi:glycosyltransferase involved in cell wall biosynthesis